MVKAALIGNGYWGSKIKKYIPEFFNLNYIADSKFDKNIIWNDKEVEAVIVATPINTHYNIVKESLQNGKHVFSEKPITLYADQAKELKQIADERGLKIGVDYIQTFSPSIIETKKIIKKIGSIKYVEMSTKHLGRFFSEYDVYWLLASHHLSILDVFADLDAFSFEFENYTYYNNICTTGSIIFKFFDLSTFKYSSFGRIDISLDFPGKEMKINFYGEKGAIKYNPLEKNTLEFTLYDKKYKALPNELIKKQSIYKFDESNNLRHAMRYFKDLLDGKATSNIDRAIKVTKILENRQ